MFLFLRERESRGGEREIERKIERIPSRLCAVSTEPGVRLMTPAEIKSQTLNQWSPQAPPEAASECFFGNRTSDSLKASIMC